MTLLDTNPEPGLLNIDQAAARLGINSRFVRRLILEKRIPYHKIGRYVRFDPIDLETWISDQRIDTQTDHSASR